MSESATLARKARKNHAILQALGDEPVWDVEKDESQLLSLLNWYRQNKDDDDAQKWFIHYFKRLDKPEAELLGLAKLGAWKIGTYGYIARMVLTSEHIPEEIKTRLHKKYEDVVLLIKPECRATVTPKENPNTRLQEQLSEYFYVVDVWLDNFTSNGFSSDVIPFEFFKEKQIKPSHIKNISERLQQKNLAELKIAQSGKDSQLSEAYKFLGKAGLKKFINFIELIVSDANKWLDISEKLHVTTRKVRAKKARPASKQIASLKYLQSHETFQSIDPVRVVGAEQLWVYNVIARTLGVYISTDSRGFGVKGCTILNFDEALSTSKKLRKPEDILPQVLTIGKVALKKLLPAIRAKEKKLTGRINKDTILVRVV